MTAYYIKKMEVKLRHINLQLEHERGLVRKLLEENNQLHDKLRLAKQ